MDPISIIHKDHDKWVKAVINFGCNPDTAEDLVAEMYVKLHILVTNGLDIMYNENEVNYFYVHRTLQSLFIDLKRKEKRVRYIEVHDHMAVMDADDVDMQIAYAEVQKNLDKLHWYDKKVWEIVDAGKSIRSLSEATKISYYSLYNTYRRVKRYLKKTLDKFE